MLKDTDFEDILKIEGSNVAYDTFLDKYLAAFDKSFPLRSRTVICDENHRVYFRTVNIIHKQI